jgi:hypothetical protein
MDGRWADGPDETSTTVNDMIQPWLPVSQWNRPVPPCARCGAAYAAHLEGRCPPAEYRAPRRDWPTRHPWYTAAILLVALLGGIGVGTASVSHINYNTPNAHACYAYWQITDSLYAFQDQTAADGWHQLLADEPNITDPTLSNAVRDFNVELINADLPDAMNTAVAIAASCNGLGYTNPS